MKKILIGIPGWSTGDNSFGVTKAYLDYIAEHLEAEPVILVPGAELNPALSLVILPGGMDVLPQHYGQAPGFYTGAADPFKEWFLKERVPQYVDAGIPLFGICLGHQQLAVHFGSTLTQNLHYHEQSPSRWTKAHDLVITEFGEQFHKHRPKKADDKYFVNSHHHQAVTLANLAKELVPVALAQNNDDLDDPLVECFLHHTLPVAGVQWHPEEWRDALSTKVVRYLLGLHKPTTTNAVMVRPGKSLC